MAQLSTSGVVRKILMSNPEMLTDEVVRRAKAQGLRVPDKAIRHSVHNQRNSVRDQVAGSTKVALAAARNTTPAKAAAVPSAVVAVVAATAPAAELTSVLANVALVNKIVGLCGSVENVRQAAEAVQACGGLEGFLRHLELVATIRAGESTS